jgi:hypothetical protein
MLLLLSLIGIVQRIIIILQQQSELSTHGYGRR